jgi:hypothetical protein
MEQATEGRSLVDAIVQDQAFQIVAIALAIDLLVLLGRSVFGDPWSGALGFMSGLIAVATLFLLFLRLVQQIVMTIWEILDALRHR